MPCPLPTYAVAPRRTNVSRAPSGSTTTTQATLRPAFEFVRTKPGVKHVSSVFFMCLPDRVLVYGDCAVIPNPSVEQLADIAIMSADTAAAFGIDPRVAMLSYSTGASGKGEDVDHVREATSLVRERRPDLLIAAWPSRSCRTARWRGGRRS